MSKIKDKFIYYNSTNNSLSLKYSTILNLKHITTHINKKKAQKKASNNLANNIKLHSFLIKNYSQVQLGSPYYNY